MANNETIQFPEEYIDGNRDNTKIPLYVPKIPKFPITKLTPTEYFEKNGLIPPSEQQKELFDYTYWHSWR
jgi:hypothetical protein